MANTVGFLERLAGAQNLTLDMRQLAIAQKQSRVFPDLFFDFWQQLGAPREEGDIREFPKAYHQDNWVRRCIELRSESVSQVRLVAKRIGEDDALPAEHPAQRLLARPNPWETWQLLIELAQTNLDATGDLYLELVEDKQQPAVVDERTGMRLPRPPAEMYVLRSDRMRILPDERTYIRGYEYHLDHKAGDPIPFGPAEVMHLRYVNPTDDYYGVSPIRAAAIPIVVDMEADKFSRAFFKNSAIPNWILETDKQLLDSTVKKLRDQIELGHRGELGWHRMLIVDDGLKAKTLGMAHSDMEFVKQRQWTLQQIAGAFGVPPAFLGETGDTNRATLRDLTLLFWITTIIPKLLKIESAFNCFIMPRFGPDIRVEFDLADIRALKADEAQKAEMGKILIASGQMTPNEVRNRFWSLPDRPEPGAARIYLPLSISPLAGEGMEEEAGAGAGAEPEALPPADDAGEADSRDEDEAEAGRSTADAQAAQERRAPLWQIAKGMPMPLVKQDDDRYRKLTTAQAAVLDAVWKQLDARLTGHERRVANIYRSMLADQREQVVQNVLAANPAATKGVGDAIELLLFAVADQVRRWTPAMLLVLENVVELSMGNVFLDVGAEIPADLIPDADQLRVLEEITAQHVRRISETTRERLRRSLLDGFAEGEGTDALIARVRGVMEARLARTALIAEQEAGTAMSIGTVQGFQAAGIQEHIWVTQRDSRVSSGTPDSKRSHVDLDGEQARVGDTFSNGLRFPRDPAGIDFEVIGCRCFVVPAGILPEF